MEAKKSEIVKNQPEPKSVYSIKVFLGFANFYQQFIQDLNKIATLLILMLKVIKLSNKPVFDKNNSSKLAFSKNNNNKLASRKNDSDNKVDGFGISNNGIKYTKKSKKLKD